MATFKEIAENINKGIQNKDADEVATGLTSCTGAQIITVANHYNDLFKRVLHEHISETLHDDPQVNLLAGFAAPKHVFLAHRLHSALQDNGATDVGAFADILGHASNEEITKINAEYQKLYNKSSLSDIKPDTEPLLKLALENLLSTKRVEHAPVDIKGTRVAEATEKFHKEGEGKQASEPEFFVKFFTENAFAHIRNVDKAYSQKYRHGILKAAESFLSGELLVLAHAATLGKADYWAYRIHESMGASRKTNNNALERAFIINNENDPDLPAVDKAYKKAYEGEPSIAVDVTYFASKPIQRPFDRLLRRYNLS